MRRILSTLLVGTSFLAGQASQSPSSLPEWLIPYPGASAVTKTFPQLVESSYTALAKPEEVAGHYAKLFAAKGLKSQANADGLGTSIRVSAPECDLLIKVRESSSGTSVKVDCSTPQLPSPGGESGNPVFLTNGSVNRPAYVPRSRNTGSGYHLKSADEIRQYNEDVAREIKASREAFDRDSNARMQVYDKPVYPQSRPLPPSASNLAPKAPIASYRDDAPALVWPSWLVAVRGQHFPQPTRSSRGPETTLSSKYETNVPMTEVERFYKEGLESNGFTILKTRIGTGSTSTGVQQNASGEVEGYRGNGPGVNPPTTTIKVSFRRTFLNAPITVWMSVSVKGSFGR